MNQNLITNQYSTEHTWLWLWHLGKNEAKDTVFFFFGLAAQYFLYALLSFLFNAIIFTCQNIAAFLVCYTALKAVSYKHLFTQEAKFHFESIIY